MTRQRKTKYYRWTAEGIATLKAGYAAGEKPYVIAERLGCQPRVVSNKAYILGFTEKKGGGKKKQPTPAQTVADHTSDRCERQAVQPEVGEVAARPAAGTDTPGSRSARGHRLACLRVAATFGGSGTAMLDLAQKIADWTGRRDRALRLEALEIAAGRHAEIGAALREANSFADWAGLSGDPAANGGTGVTGALDRIEELTEAVTGVKLQMLRGDSRVARDVQARHLLCYAAYHLTGASYSQIGRRLGNRDHTTIFYAVKRIDAARGCPETERSLAKIAAAFGGDLPAPPVGRAPKPAATPAPKPEPAPRSTARGPGKPAAAPRPTPAADRTLTETEQKVLRAIIRDGKGTAAMIGAHAGLEPGPVANVLSSLRRKEYIEFKGGQIKPLRLPNGTEIAPPPAGPVAIKVTAPVRLSKPKPKPAAKPAVRPSPRPAPPPDPLDRAWESDWPKRMDCMTCGGGFMSEHKGHRRCAKCRKLSDDDWMGGVSP